jgi:hypothetical protein
MSLKIRFQKTRSSLGRKLFGVWGVRDYYTRLEQIAADGAKMTYGYVLMVLASAAMATGGLLIKQFGYSDRFHVRGPFPGSLAGRVYWRTFS